jgi:hypothetical protein
MKLRIRTKIMVARAAGALLLPLLAGCGNTPSHSTSADGGETFIAVTGSFADYKTWPSYDGGTNVLDSVPVDTPRIMYLNEPPAHGSKSFPVGTIIVKTAEGGQTFAMVKRGGDFNYTGSRGWEWFEIADSAEGKPVIIWRGTAPPSGQTYGGVPTASCNACHAQSVANDYVSGSVLDLSTF